MDVQRYEKATSRGGELWEHEGVNTSPPYHTRILKIKHYENQHQVDISIGAGNSRQARASIRVNVTEIDEIVESLLEAKEKAVECVREYQAKRRMGDPRS